MSRGLLVPWGSGGLNTHDLLALTLDNFRSSVRPEDIEWFPLSFYVCQRVSYSPCTQSESHSYVLKSQVYGFMYIFSRQCQKKNYKKKDDIKKKE